ARAVDEHVLAGRRRLDEALVGDDEGVAVAQALAGVDDLAAGEAPLPVHLAGQVDLAGLVLVAVGQGQAAVRPQGRIRHLAEVVERPARLAVAAAQEDAVALGDEVQAGPAMVGFDLRPVEAATRAPPGRPAVLAPAALLRGAVADRRATRPGADGGPGEQ